MLLTERALRKRGESPNGELAKFSSCWLRWACCCCRETLCSEDCPLHGNTKNIEECVIPDFPAENTVTVYSFLCVYPHRMHTYIVCIGVCGTHRFGFCVVPSAPSPPPNPVPRPSPLPSPVPPLRLVWPPSPKPVPRPPPSPPPRLVFPPRPPGTRIERTITRCVLFAQTQPRDIHHAHTQLMHSLKHTSKRETTTS